MPSFGRASPCTHSLLRSSGALDRKQSNPPRVKDDVDCAGNGTRRSRWGGGLYQCIEKGCTCIRPLLFTPAMPNKATVAIGKLGIDGPT